MSMTNVPSQIASPYPRKKKTMKLFYHLLSDMSHQRVAVISMAVGQVKIREEYYETPKIHGISTNDMRFMEADKLVNYTLILLYSATALATTYAICTLGLLIGLFKRRCELILPWIIFQSIVCVVFALTLLFAYVCPNEFFIRYMGTKYVCRWFISLFILFINLICLLLVLKYYKGLKMLKRLTEEVVIPITYRAVPFHFRKENMYVGTGGYKHLLSDTNSSYVV